MRERQGRYGTMYICAALVAAALAAGCGGREGRAKMGKAGEKRVGMALELYDGGHFALLHPRGWQVIAAGDCARFAFAVRDPGEPLRRIFCLGRAGGAEAVLLDDPGVLIRQAFRFAVEEPEYRALGLGVPVEDVVVISSAREEGAASVLARAVFRSGAGVGEGYFFLRVAPAAEEGGRDVLQVAALTAAQAELLQIAPVLAKCVESFNLGQEYVAGCEERGEGMAAPIWHAGNTLREISEAMLVAWERRTPRDDLAAAHARDELCGMERMYHPGTREVYEFPVGFYARHKEDDAVKALGPLEPLPENMPELWLMPPLDGARSRD